MGKSTSWYDKAIKQCGEAWKNYAKELVKEADKRMQKTQLDPTTIKAIESVLSKGDRAVVIPLKDGGVRVNHEMSKTVCMQEAKGGSIRSMP